MKVVLKFNAEIWEITCALTGETLATECEIQEAENYCSENNYEVVEVIDPEGWLN